MQTTIALVVIFLVCIGYFLYKRGILETPKVASNKAMKRLLSICRGDEDRAKRLINLEIKRSPNISSREAVNRAIKSYTRDQ